MASVDAQIHSVGATISDTIDALAHDRGLLSRNVIKQLRDLVEAVAVRLHKGNGLAGAGCREPKSLLRYKRRCLPVEDLRHSLKDHPAPPATKAFTSCLMVVWGLTGPWLIAERLSS